MSACAVAIGTFDGVHVGHQAVIRQTLEQARRLGGASVALTFDPHPADVLQASEGPVPWITLPAEREALLRAHGIDRVVTLPFDLELADVEAETFVRDELLDRQSAGWVVVGEGFRFGRAGLGDVALLQRIGEALGFGVTGVPKVSVDGGSASSTRIRQAVAAGDLAAAQRILGRPHSLCGRVQHGDHRGRTLGFPTANLPLDPAKLVPPDGIYAVRVRSGGGKVWPGAASMGGRPTFGPGPRLCEAHLIGFTGDLYGKTLTVEFVARIRGNEKFASVNDLVHAMEGDVRCATAILDAFPADVVP